MTDRIRIFSNGSQFNDWSASNCERCTKWNGFDLPITCEIDIALGEAYLGDGTVSQEIAKRAGYDADRYVWPCSEVEWTEEWMAEKKRMIKEEMEKGVEIKMGKYYILEGQKVIETDNVIAWGEWFGETDRTVLKTQTGVDVEVSTVFLGLDHQWGDGPPLLFETMVSGGEFDQDQYRYSTWDEAVRGHSRVVKEIVDTQQK